MKPSQSYGNYLRVVGTESSRTHLEKLENGFYDKYMSGQGIEIGFQGYQVGAHSILTSAIGLDFGYPEYDGVNLPFEAESQDYVYSSHCLEHIDDYKAVIKEWYRVTKFGGHIVTVVPHRDLYERRLNPPSQFNGDHKHFFTNSLLLSFFEESLPINSYRTRFLEDNDTGYDYFIPDGQHPKGAYETILVIQKIKGNTK